MWRRFLAFSQRDPLLALTLIALVPRMLAAFFSGGYFAHDDHFLVVEAAGSWVAGSDYNNWLPWHQGDDPRPTGHSLFYAGLHYLLFVVLKFLGITAPATLIIVVQLLHAIWSLVVVRVGYRILLHLSRDAGMAWRGGLFLALFYFMPFLAVRTLAEVACIPFLMLGAWHAIRTMENSSWRSALLAGVFFGLAIDLRFQTLFFAAGAGLGFLLLRRVKAATVFGAGVLLPLLVVQGGVDIYLWGRPFAELSEYVLYNMANATTYFDQPWYNFLLLLSAVFVPPFSLCIVFGFFRRWKPLPLWLAAFAFLAFHSWHPNKQERFIFPLLPLFFVLGYVAWEHWRLASAWWHARPGLWKGLMRFTWGLNTVILVVLCFSFSKRSRVEAMEILREQPEVKGIIVEDTYEHGPPMMPLFYLDDYEVGVIEVADTTFDLPSTIANYVPERQADHVLFFGLEDLEARRARMEGIVGPLTEVGRARPGFLDRTVHWLNPVNRNETIVVTRMERAAR